MKLKFREKENFKRWDCGVKGRHLKAYHPDGGRYPVSSLDGRILQSVRSECTLFEEVWGNTPC